VSEWGAWGRWPLEWGAAPSSAGLVYDALRSLLGGDDGGELGPVGGLDDARIFAYAVTIDAITSMPEAAAMQAFPAHASHLLDFLIEESGLDPEGDDEQSRAALVVLDELASDMQRFEVELAAISSKLAVVYYDDTTTRESRFGRDLSPRSEALRNECMFPAYSDRDVIWIVYTLGTDTVIPPSVIRAVRKLISDVMPAHVDFTLTTAGPFLCDGGPSGTSLLDQTQIG